MYKGIFSNVSLGFIPGTAVTGSGENQVQYQPLDAEFSTPLCQGYNLFYSFMDCCVHLYMYDSMFRNVAFSI